MSKLLIVGAKGFAKELLEVVIQGEPEANVTFFDEVNTELPELLFARYKVIRNETEAVDYFTKIDRAFGLGVGNPKTREMLFNRMKSFGGQPRTIISPYAHIGSFGTDIGIGSTIMTGVTITNDIRIGIACLLNLNVTVGHDVSIGDFCELSPGVHISGNVSLDRGCQIGTGAVVLPGRTLGANVVVGAGAVVTKDFPENTTVAGVPAKVIDLAPSIA